MRAVAHIIDLLQAQGSELRNHAAAIQELRSGSSAFTTPLPSSDETKPNGMAARHSTHTPKQGQLKLLKENERIIDYWNRAAQRDPVRETVTQRADESDEEYLHNWDTGGEYVAAKIMSYSPPNPVALEIGPGMGRITVPMARRCQSILALDIAPEMVRRTRETLAGLANFDVQLITDEDLSFLPDQHFDLAYSIACFQHADKKSFYRYLRGIQRSLKPGGVLFFGVMNLCSERGWQHFQAIVENDYPEFFHTPEEISCYLTHAGYSSHELAYEGETLWAIAHR